MRVRYCQNNKDLRAWHSAASGGHVQLRDCARHCEHSDFLTHARASLIDACNGHLKTDDYGTEAPSRQQMIEQQNDRLLCLLPCRRNSSPRLTGAASRSQRVDTCAPVVVVGGRQCVLRSTQRNQQRRRTRAQLVTGAGTCTRARATREHQEVGQQQWAAINSLARSRSARNAHARAQRRKHQRGERTRQLHFVERPSSLDTTASRRRHKSPADETAPLRLHADEARGQQHSGSRRATPERH